MKGFEGIKEIFKDNSLHLFLGIITKLIVAKDKSYLKVELEVMPEKRKIIANMTWEVVGPESGDFDFPSPGDAVLCGNVEGDDDQAYVLKRLTSREDKIPEIAVTGDKVHKAKAGKKYWNISDLNIYLSRADTPPTENLVLGQVFKQFASDLLDHIKEQTKLTYEHTHIGNLGYNTTAPNNSLFMVAERTSFNTLKTSPITDEAILSDLSFTEK